MEKDDRSTPSEREKAEEMELVLKTAYETDYFEDLPKTVRQAIPRFGELLRKYEKSGKTADSTAVLALAMAAVAEATSEDLEERIDVIAMTLLKERLSASD